MNQYLFLRKCQEGNLEVIKKNLDKLYENYPVIREYSNIIFFSVKKKKNDEYIEYMEKQTIEPIEYVIASKKKKTVEYLLERNLIEKRYYPEILNYYPNLIDKIKDKLFGINFYQKLFNSDFNIMEMAILKEEKNLIQFIYESGYNPYRKINNLNCAEFAIKNKKIAILDFLFKNVYDINYLDSDGFSCLDYILKHRCPLPEKLNYLLKLKLRKNLAWKIFEDKIYIRTTLSTSNNIEFIQYLIKINHGKSKIIFNLLINELSIEIKSNHFYENIYKLLGDMIKKQNLVDENYLLELLNGSLFNNVFSNFYLLKLFISNNLVIELKRSAEDKTPPQKYEMDDSQIFDNIKNSYRAIPLPKWQIHKMETKKYEIIFENNVKRAVVSYCKIEKIYSAQIWKKKRLLYIALMKPNDKCHIPILGRDMIEEIFKWIS